MLGKFITFEGIEGSGTTVQSALVAAALRGMGHAVYHGAEPNEELESGKRVRRILQGEKQESHEELPRLSIENRCEDLALRIMPALGRGELVILDRYADWTFAHGMLALTKERISVLHRQIIAGFMEWPSLTILLDVSVATGLRRTTSASPEIFDRVETQERVRDNYRRLAVWSSERIVVVDGEPSQDRVFEAVMAIIRERAGL